MKSNRIQIKFASESHFEKFSFNSETITYQEVIEYLSKKKKIDIQKKTDQITLRNIDQDNAEITNGIIYAGSRLVAIRKPEQPAKTDTIELTYSAKQTVDRSRSSAKQRYELRKQADRNSLAPTMQEVQENEDDDEDDDIEPKDKELIITAIDENPEEPLKVKFKSCKLDMSKVFPELMCPFGQVNESKYEQAIRAGKIDKSGELEDMELRAGLVKAHYIAVPMLATCCGISACYDCIKDAIAEQYRRAGRQEALASQIVAAKSEPQIEIECANDSEAKDLSKPQEKEEVSTKPEELEAQSVKDLGNPEEKPEETKICTVKHAKQSATQIFCPFCAQAHQVGETPNRTEVSFLVHNRPLDNLMSQEIQQVWDQLTEQEKEQLNRNKVKNMLQDMAQELHLKQTTDMRNADQNNEGQNNVEENQHELLEAIDDNTKFLLLKIPNQDCLMNSLIKNEIALSELSTQAFETTFAKHKEENSLVLFVTIQGSEQLQGVCKVTTPKLIEEVREDWQQFWQGKFRSTISVTWLIPFCAMPLSKVNQFLQPVLAKNSSDHMVELALQAVDNASFKFNEADMFGQKVRNLLEIPHDAGIQISKSYVNWQKLKLAETDQTVQLFAKQLNQWKQEQEEKNILPSLPPLQIEKPSQNSEDLKQQQLQLAGAGDFEMVDAMLYADLDLDVKLSDVITGLKDYSKVGQQSMNQTEQTSDPKPVVGHPIGQVGPGGVGVTAAQAAGLNSQYDPATMQLWQSLLMQAARQNKMPQVQQANQAAFMNQQLMYQFNNMLPMAQGHQQQLQKMTQQQPLSQEMMQNLQQQMQMQMQQQQPQTQQESFRRSSQEPVDHAQSQHRKPSESKLSVRKSEPRESKERRSSPSYHHRRNDDHYKSRSRSKSRLQQKGGDSDNERRSQHRSNSPDEYRQKSSRKGGQRSRSRENSREHHRQQSASKSKYRAAGSSKDDRSRSLKDTKSDKPSQSRSSYRDKDGRSKRDVSQDSREKHRSDRDDRRDRDRDRDRTRKSDNYTSKGGSSKYPSKEDNRDRDRDRDRKDSKRRTK